MPTIITTNDGIYYKTAGNYSDARDAAASEGGFSKPGSWYVHYLGSAANSRAFYAFDTSGISVVPASATISIWGSGGQGAHNSRLVKSTAPVDLVTATTNNSYNDIVGFVSGSSMAGNVTDYSDTVSAWVNYQFMVYTLTAAALSDMASQNVLSVCNVNYDYDYLNVNASSILTSGIFSGHGTVAQRPKLDYVEGVAGYSHDVLGVDSGDIGKIIGVAAAAVTKVCGRAA
jgi:hypothetical protein